MKKTKLCSIVCILIVLISLTACVTNEIDSDAVCGSIVEISKYGNVK